MTGQEAVHVAETFNTQLDVTGILLTKIDGDARGGAALSVREAVGKPIKYISTGEKMDALEDLLPGPHGQPYPWYGRCPHSCRKSTTEHR